MMGNTGEIEQDSNSQPGLIKRYTNSKFPTEPHDPVLSLHLTNIGNCSYQIKTSRLAFNTCT